MATKTNGTEKRERRLMARAQAALLELGGRKVRRRRSGDVEREGLVCDAMSRQVAAIDIDAPVTAAAELLAEQDVGALMICRPGDRLRGVITDRDIVVRVVGQGLDPDELTVGECGSGEPATVSPRDTLERAAQRMEEEQVRRLPVTEAHRVIGILSHSDLAAHGADRRAARLLGRLTRCSGDRRSAHWLLDHPYREERRIAEAAPRLLGRL
jgi:CBS domain-containing protein